MNEKTAWWQGTFPIWIVAILLTLIGYGGSRELARNDAEHLDYNVTLRDIISRITTLELRYGSISENLSSLRVGQEKLISVLVQQNKTKTTP